MDFDTVMFLREAIEEWTESQILFVGNNDSPYIEWHFYPPSFSYQDVSEEMWVIIGNWLEEE